MSLYKMMYYVGGATLGGYILLKLVERDPESVRKVRPRLVLFFSFSSVFGLMCLAWVYACKYMFNLFPFYLSYSIGYAVLNLFS